MICTTCNVAHERTYVGAIDVECWGNERCAHWAGPPPGPEPEHWLMGEARRAAMTTEWHRCPGRRESMATPERVADIHARLVEAFAVRCARRQRMVININAPAHAELASASAPAPAPTRSVTAPRVHRCGHGSTGNVTSDGGCATCYLYVHAENVEISYVGAGLAVAGITAEHGDWRASVSGEDWAGLARMLREKLAAEAPAPETDEAFVRRHRPEASVVSGLVRFIWGIDVAFFPDWVEGARFLREGGLT